MIPTIPATGTTVDVFGMPGYSVTTAMVDRVDNQGEPCEVCTLLGRYVNATVYGVVLGEHANLWMGVECCIFCVPAVIATMDPTADVAVELGNSQDDEMFDDRMHSQDCGCVHPDAR